MQQVIYFLQKYKYFLFFLLLEFVAIAFTINNNTFHKSKFISSANDITGGFYDTSSRLTDYLNLNVQNKELIEENVRLKNKLQLIESFIDSTITETTIDTVKYHQRYTYSKAKITRNNYINPNNFILINRGTNQNVTSEMAVINSKGIIGIIDDSGNNHSRVQSILNTNSKINARLKNSYHFGTLIWNSIDYNTVQLVDIPRQANITIGDTIITGGKSTIFPEGIPIGTIKNTDNSQNSIDIALFNDMSNLGYVYVIKSLDKEEINSLENTSNE